MGRRISEVALAGLLVAGVIAAGCGGDDDDDDGTSSQTIGKQEWIREADKICARLDHKRERETREFFAGGPPGEEAPPSQIEKYGEQIVYPNLQKQIDRIKALPPPDQDADQATAVRDAAQQGLDELEQHPQRLAKGGASTAFEKAQKLAGEFGLDKCASG
jgi:hypothetical protein